MPKDYTIREFLPKDAVALAELSNKNLEHFQYPVNPDFLIQMSIHPRFSMFVAEEDSLLVGFCGVNYEHLPFIEIGPVGVEGFLRKKGIAKALLKHTLDYSKALGAKVAVSKVKAENSSAQKFFISSGFEKDSDGILDGQKVIIFNLRI